jgi:MFS family permease
MSADDRAPRPSPQEPEFSAAYTRYALVLLVVVYILNFIDRQVLTILLEPIKEDLDLSDTQLGFLTGIAFALLYSTLGIPLARWADRRTRRNLIAVSIFVWSVMTALQGLAKGFGTLALARVGVGIGEAGCSPPAHSILSDLFRPERRATALSIYALGIPIGGGLGYLFGGWLEEFFDWRIAFMVVGLPGVLIALVVRFTLREPTRGYWEGGGADEAGSEPPTDRLVDVGRFMLGLPAFRHFSFAAALHAFYGYGAAAFNPSFFRRVHEIPVGELGTWLALIAVTTGVAGTFLGGFLADRIGRRDTRWYMWLPAIATTIGVPFVALLYLVPDGYEAIAVSAIPALLGSMYLGPTFAMAQAIVPARMRAMASATLLFIINLIGLGLGPQFVGLLSDMLAPTYGVDSIRYALLWTVGIGAGWSSIHYLLAARTLRDDLRAQEQF